MLNTEKDDKRPGGWLDDLIVKVGNAASFFYLVSAVIIMWEIIARYVFNAPTYWAHETTILVCALLYAYAGSHCLARNKHIRIVILYDAVSPKIRRWLDVIISGLCVIFTVGLAWGGWLVMGKAIFTPQGEFRMETSGSAWDPPFPAITKMFLFFMLSIMLVQFILHFISYLRSDKNA